MLNKSTTSKRSKSNSASLHQTQSGSLEPGGREGTPSCAYSPGPLVSRYSIITIIVKIRAIHDDFLLSPRHEERCFMIFNWWGLVIFVILMAVVSAIAIRGGARRPARSGVPIARITRVVAVIYVAASVVGTLIVVLQTLINSRVRVWMPVREFWPNLPSTVQLHGVSGQVVGGGFSNADVEVTGLDSAARIWLASGALVQGLTAVMVGLVVAKLCTSVLRQNPVRAMLSRGINLAAFGILLGGIFWQICLVVGNGMASTQVLGVNGWDLDEDNMH